MSMQGINFLAVLAAAVASMAIGFLWYSPALFAKPWMKAMGWENMDAAQMAEMKKKAGPMYGASFVGFLITAFVMSKFAVAMHLAGSTHALKLGAAVWLGFVAPVQLTDVLFGGKKRELFPINTGYQLVCMWVMALIVVLWR